MSKNISCHRKYKIGDTFCFPNILMTHYENNKPKEKVSFADCIAVLVKTEQISAILSSVKNLKSHINNDYTIYYIEVEDKNIETNGITFTMQVDKEFMDILPRAYASDGLS